MMTTLINHRSFASLLLVLPVACGEAAASEPEGSAAAPAVAADSPGPSAEAKAAVDPNANRPLTPEEIVLPEPEVELPELPYEKTELEHVLTMDGMIVDSKRLAAAVSAFEQMVHALEESANVSMNGTAEDQIKAVLVMVDGFREFDRRAIPFGRKAEAVFKAKYSSDEEFSSTFRETFSLAEEALYDVIEDNVVRRATGAAMTNGYRYASGSNVSYLESMLTETEELRAQTLQRVVRSVETDMMVADYKKGAALTDLLRSSRSLLEIAEYLDADGQVLADAMAKVVAKEESRKAEIAAAREAYRFPARYDGPTLPSDHEELESQMRAFMKASGYDPRQLVLASGWIEVRSVLGIHLYDQIDFYVAVRNAEESGVIDVLYVTGKTGGAGTGISRMSVGTIAQMLESNL